MNMQLLHCNNYSLQLFWGLRAVQLLEPIMSVKTRLILMAASSLAFTLLLLGIAIFQMNDLAKLQDEGFSKTQTQTAAAEAAQLGSQFYQIIADTIINRNIDESKKDFAEMRKEAAGDLERLAKEADTAEERQAVSAAQKSVAELSELFEKKLLPMLNDQNKVSDELKSLDGDIDRNVKDIRDQLKKVADSMHMEAEIADKEFDATRTLAIRSTLIVSMLAAIALAIFAWLMIRSIMLPLEEAQRVAARIAAGDLTQAVVVGRNDEFGKMLASCELMRTSLRDIAQAIQTGSNDIASTSSQLASTTGQIALATETQAQAVSNMAASVEEFSVSIAHMSDRAGEVRNAAIGSGEVADQGATAVTKLLDENNRVALNVETVANQIQDLSALSERISSIVSVIREVADQTNLLALNAAIEAARAGEQGRGFAVVADEVRKLAERTSKSTQDISAVIDEVQRATLAAATTMEQTVAEEREGISLSSGVGESIAKIRSESSRVVTAVEEITSALHEQSTASTEIARGVEMIAQMGEENSAAVKETASAANNLESLAARLQTVAARFRL